MSADSTNFGSFGQRLGADSLWTNEFRSRKLDQLVHHAQRPGSICMVNAAAGFGKSTTAQWLYQQFNLEDFEVLLQRISASNVAEGSLNSPFWRSLSHYFSPVARREVSDGERRATLIRHLQGFAKTGRRLVILLDLQDSKAPTALAGDLEQLLELRSLFDTCIALVIFSEPEQKSAFHIYPTLRDRIGFEWTIPALDENETMEYLAHGTKRLGFDGHFFSERSMQLVSQHSNGVFTRINTIADACLVECRRQRAAEATPEIVSEVCSSLSFRGKSATGAGRAKTPAEFSKADASQSQSQTQIAARQDAILRLPKLSPLSTLLLDEEAS